MFSRREHRFKYSSFRPVSAPIATTSVIAEHFPKFRHVSLVRTPRAAKSASRLQVWMSKPDSPVSTTRALMSVKSLHMTMLSCSS